MTELIHRSNRLPALAFTITLGAIIILGGCAGPGVSEEEPESVSARIAFASAGSLRAGSTLAHSMDLVGAAVVMEGNTITMAGAYPEASAAGITATLQEITGFNPTYVAVVPFSVVYEIDGAPAGNTCDVTYQDVVGGAPTITLDVGTC